MQLATLKLDEESELEFDLQIFGTTEQTKDIRFVIEGEGYTLSFKGDYANGSVKVKIPQLKHLMPAGVHECKMEVIVAGKIFTPLTETIEFAPLIEMDMKHAKVEVVQESVAVKPVKVTSKKTSKILEAQQLGYEVVNYKDQKILKRDGRYHGIVNEQNMILAQYPTDTVVELISSL